MFNVGQANRVYISGRGADGGWGKQVLDPVSLQ